MMFADLLQGAFPDVVPMPNRKQRRAGSYGRRIIKTVRRNGRLMEFHATKGWRSYRDPARS